jgi:hypothetical protein
MQSDFSAVKALFDHSLFYLLLFQSLSPLFMFMESDEVEGC